MAFSLRQFLPHEVNSYRSIRLEALQSESGFFGNSFEKETAFAPEIWQQRLENPLCACFGLYDDNSLIGLTSILTTPDKPGEGYLTQSYIRKAYRGVGLSRLFYETRIDWARKAGLRYLLVGHRASNIISKAANQRFGFKYAYSESREWPDGGVADMCYYKLEIGDNE